MLRKLLSSIFMMTSFAAFSQNVAINADGTLPNSSAMLDVKSTNKGVLIPRMSETQRDNIPSPATGLLIYQTGNGEGFYYNSGTPGAPVWRTVGIAGSGTNDHLSKFGGVGLTNSLVRDNGTSVGIDTMPNQNIKFQVYGNAIGNTIRGTLNTTPSVSIATAGSIYGESNTGIGVIGVSGSQNGVYGLSSGTLGGTVGVNTGTGNAIWGVYTGTSNSGTAGYFDGGMYGKGVVVLAGASGFGTTTPANRISARTSTTNNFTDTSAAIVGYAGNSIGVVKGGVRGEYDGAYYGAGVVGIGYQGIEKESAIDAGVYGSSTNGVYGKTNSFGGKGVYGYSPVTGGIGVYGAAPNSSANWAGYFVGNVGITGSIAKGAGTFKIDHPLDPENKYLYHSFVESPDMMNIYNGNITTDANGEASITLPDYFPALNKDFRYQLTVVDPTQFAQARVSKEISGNTFTIKTDKPGIKISWQVTGVRQDKYANAHRVIPEAAKEPENKGYYLHAAEWGQPQSKSMDEHNRADANNKSTRRDGQNISREEKTGTAPAVNDPKTVGGAEIK